MTSLELNLFSPSESTDLKSLLKNPDEDFHKIISLLEAKVIENTKKLKDLDKKYRYFIENSIEGVWVVDDNANTVLVNPSMANMLGYKMEEMIGKSLFAFMNEDSANITKLHLEKRKKGISEERDAVMFHKNGNNIYLRIRASPIFNNKGIYEGTYAFLSNINERKFAEEKLKNAERRLRSLIEQTTDAVFCYEFDPPIPIDLPIETQVELMYDCILIDCNLVCAQSYGANQVEDVIGRKLTELFGTTPSSLDKLFRSMIKGGYCIVDGVGVEKLPNGEERFFLNNGHGVIEDGKLIRIWGTFRDITDRIKVEHAMKESEESYRALFENSPIALMDQDFSEVKRYIDHLKASGINDFKNFFERKHDEVKKCISKVKIVDVNRKTLELYESKSKEDFIPRMNQASEDISDKMTEEELLDNKMELLSLIEGNRIYESEFDTKTSTGENRSFYAKTSLVQGFESTWSKVIVSILDITEKKKAEQKLKESEEKFRTLFEIAPASIVVLDLEGKIILGNQKFCNLHGVKNSKLLEGRKILDFIAEKDWPILKEGMQKSLKGLPRGLNHYTMLREDGTEFQAEAISLGIKNKDGKINGLMGVAQDITERKIAEEKLKESEEKFRNISEQSLIGIGIVQDNVVKYVNKKFADIFGYAVTEILDWSPEEFMITVHPEDREFVFDQVKKKQTGSEAYLKNYQFRGIKKSGEIIWIENYTKTITYEGRIADFVAFIDITERKNAQQELIKLSQLKSELLRRTSHELKTPLVSIKGFTELLLEVHRDKLDALVISTLNEIQQGCLRLETLVGDILKTAELESGITKLHKSEEDLTFLVRLCVKEIKGFSKLRNHTINLELHEKLITQFEKEQIHQVIGNLLNNAVKYTPPGGSIEVKSEIKDNQIILSICDDGIGFTNDEKNRIFSQFGKIERYGQGLDIIAEGSGFGLFISKKIMELHEGDIWVESAGRNKGSTFFISLPII